MQGGVTRGARHRSACVHALLLLASCARPQTATLAAMVVVRRLAALEVRARARVLCVCVCVCARARVCVREYVCVYVRVRACDVRHVQMDADVM